MTSVKEKLASVFRKRGKRQYDLEDYIRHQQERGFSVEHGSLQIVDGTPMAPPIGYKKAPSMVELIREAVASHHLAAAAKAAGHETFEESEDFDVPDDPVQLQSQWENEFDPPLDELLRAGEEVLKERRAAAAARPAPKPGPDDDPRVAPPKLPEHIQPPKPEAK